MIDGPRRAAQLGRIRGGHDACAAENVEARRHTGSVDSRAHESDMNDKRLQQWRCDESALLCRGFWKRNLLDGLPRDVIPTPRPPSAKAEPPVRFGPIRLPGSPSALRLRQCLLPSAAPQRR